MTAQTEQKTYYYNELDEEAKKRAVENLIDEEFSIFQEGIFDYGIINDFIGYDIVELTKREYPFIFKNEEGIYWEYYYGVSIDFSNLVLSEDDAIDIIKNRYKELRKQGEISEEEYRDIIQKIDKLVFYFDYPNIEIFNSAYDNVLDFNFDIYDLYSESPFEILGILKEISPEDFKPYRITYSVMTPENAEDFIDEDQISKIIDIIQDIVDSFSEEIADKLARYLEDYRERIKQNIEDTYKYYESKHAYIDALEDTEKFIYDIIRFDKEGNIIRID